MSTPPTKPSSKGYTPVPPMPLAEQIDDGVEQPQTDAEAAGGNDDLYTSTPPLLSNRSRGNETPLRVGNNNWFERLQSWRPFTLDNRYASFNSSSKARNWRKITLWTLFGTLVAAVVALSISTGVLANQLQSARGRSYYCPGRSYQNSHVPFNQNWQSSNNRLNFARVYPPLDTSASLSCQAAWNTLTYVPCHEKIWNRAWDNGTDPALFDPNIALYTSAMCQYSSCENHINNAYLLVASACTEKDVFDMSNYLGPFSVDPGLEASPLGVITTLARRLQHMCRKDPHSGPYYSWDKPFCTANMWEDWRIVDGMNAGNLNGLDLFEKTTNFPRTINYRQQLRTHMEDTCDDAYYSATYRYGQRTFGPSANSTTCDYCTMNWFERKLMGWEKDQVKDPKTGKVVELQDYLKRIRSVGVRCDADAWDRVWYKAVRKYKMSGDLPKNWDGEDDDDKHGKKPCHCADAGGKGKPCAKKEQVVEEEEAESFPYIEIEATPASDDDLVVIVD